MCRHSFLWNKATVYRNSVALVHRGGPIKGEPLLVSQIVLYSMRQLSLFCHI